MGILIAVVVVAAFVWSSIYLWKVGVISKNALTITLSLALVVASVLYWISQRAV